MRLQSGTQSGTQSDSDDNICDNNNTCDDDYDIINISHDDNWTCIEKKSTDIHCLQNCNAICILIPSYDFYSGLNTYPSQTACKLFVRDAMRSDVFVSIDETPAIRINSRESALRFGSALTQRIRDKLTVVQVIMCCTQAMMVPVIVALSSHLGEDEYIGEINPNQNPNQILSSEHKGKTNEELESMLINKRMCIRVSLKNACCEIKVVKRMRLFRVTLQNDDETVYLFKITCVFDALNTTNASVLLSISKLSP